MRIISACIFAFSLVTIIFHNPTFSQTPNLDKKITIIARDSSLNSVLEEISKKGGINFSFSDEHIPIDKKVTIVARKKSIKYILNKLSADLSIEYKLVEKQIILKPTKTAGEEDNPVEKTLPKYTISGYIKDKGNGELLLGSTIWVPELTTGTSTNAYGFYSITLPEGDYTLQFSSIGYENYSTPIELRKNQKINMDLPVNEALLSEVIIVASEQENPVEEIQMSEVKFKTSSIAKMPGIMGETELIKSLQSVPGIKTYGDGSVFFYVRGGNKDQNLILIDDAPIYNPSHLFGFFSSITPDAIKDVQIYKGDIPISHGGALSSLIDIKTKDGNLKKYSTYGSIGLIASKLTSEGPIKKDKSSFFISARKSHLKWLLPKSVRDNLELRFYDFNTKLNYTFNDKNRLYLSIYSGKDVYSRSRSGLGSFGIRWGNTAATLRWNHLFNDKLFSNTTLYMSKYDYFLITSIENNTFWNETITNLSLKSDFSYYINPRNTMKFGIKMTRHHFNPGNFELGTTTTEFDIPKVPQSLSRHLVVYAGHEHKINDKFSLRYGLRFNVWQNVGPTEVYLFDDNYTVTDTIIAEKQKVYNTYINFEPRLAVKYSLNSTSSLKASYGRTCQYLQLLSNSTSPFTSLDIWLPSGPNIKPQEADQVVLGYHKAIMKKKSTIGIEVYYKQMYNQIDYKDHANMLLNPLIEGELRFGRAWSYGVEFSIQKTRGRLTGWISYTLSKTMKEIKGINNDQPYPAFQDRPHDFSITLAYKVSKRWNFSANWIYTTGSAITTPTSFYYYQGVTVPIFASKNNGRLPDYHRLDIAGTFNLNKKPDSRYKHSLTFSLYNAYNRKNPISVNFNKKEAGNDKFIVPANLLAESDLVATELSLLGVIPSITYIFQF